jgi:hypothetical protein
MLNVIRRTLDSIAQWKHTQGEETRLRKAAKVAAIVPDETEKLRNARKLS